MRFNNNNSITHTTALPAVNYMFYMHKNNDLVVIIKCIPLKFYFRHAS